MTRPTYGGAAGDFGFEVVNDYLRTNGGSAPVWDTETGGNRITDLQTTDGVTTTVAAIADDASTVAIRLPDGYTGEAYVGPAAGPRVRLTPPSIVPATDSEVATGTDLVRFVSPSTLATRLASFRTTLLGGAQAAWDTLQELKDLEDTNLGNLMTAIGGKLGKSSNLSDLSDAPTARGNLGLGAAATKSVADIAGDALLINAFGAGSDLWLKLIAQDFGFVFTGGLTIDATTGLPTAGAVKWPDGKTGAFTGTVDANYYTGFTVTWVNGGTTKTVTVTGISYDTASGFPLGPTGLAVA